MSAQPNERSQSPALERHTVVSLQQYLNPGVTNTIVTNYTTLIGNDGTLVGTVEQSAFTGLGRSVISGSFFGINANEEGMELIKKQAVLQRAKSEAEHAHDLTQPQ